jgi:hypothetical protein
MGRGLSDAALAAPTISAESRSATRRRAKGFAEAVAATETIREACRQLPKGVSRMCVPASVLLAYRLRGNGADAEVVVGLHHYTRDVSGRPMRFSCNHAWVQLTGEDGRVHVLDPTREQFSAHAPVCEPWETASECYTPDPDEIPGTPAFPDADAVAALYAADRNDEAYRGGRLMRLISAVAPELAAPCRRAARRR